MFLRVDKEAMFRRRRLTEPRGVWMCVWQSDERVQFVESRETASRSTTNVASRGEESETLYLAVSLVTLLCVSVSRSSVKLTQERMQVKKQRDSDRSGEDMLEGDGLRKNSSCFSNIKIFLISECALMLAQGTVGAYLVSVQDSTVDRDPCSGCCSDL